MNKYARLYLITLSLLLLFLTAASSQAAATSFSVNPAITALYTSSFPIHKKIILKNLSDQTQDISLQIIPIEQDQTGNVVLLPAPNTTDPEEKVLLKNITLSLGKTPLKDNNLTLLPNQTINLMLKIPTSKNYSLSRDYYFSIIYISKDNNTTSISGKEVSAIVKQEGSIAGLFLISTNQAKSNTLSGAIQTPIVIFSHTFSPRLNLVNHGRSLAELEIHYTLKGMFGITYVDQYLTKRYILSQSQNSIDIPEINIPSMLLGPVWIQTEINDLHSGSSIELTKTIFLFPIKPLATMLLCLIALILIILRVKKHLDKEGLIL